MRRLIFLLLLTSYCCFAQKTVQQLETEFLGELVDVHRRVKSVEDENRNLIEGKYVCKSSRSYFLGQVAILVKVFRNFRFMKEL